MDLNNQLIAAAKNGQLEQVNQLLAQGADPTYNNSDALQWAARNGHSTIVIELIDAGAIINANDNNALKWAKRNNHPQIVRVLEKRQSKPGYLDNKMLIALDNKDFSLAKSLINAGANPNYKDGMPLRMAARGNNLDTVKFLVNNGVTIKPDSNYITSAVYNNNLQMMQYLIDNSTDINAARDFALSSAVETNIDLVKYLLDQGANINDPKSKAFYLAVYSNNLPMVKYLVSRGADVNLPNGSPLRIAAKGFFDADPSRFSPTEIQEEERKYYEMVKYLVSQGADVSVLTPEQRRRYNV